jgi:phosphoglucosamine mutase
MQDPYDFPELVAAFEAASKQIEGRGRILIRKSGTEPLIRVMVELDNAEECDKLAHELADKVKQVMA